MAGKHRRRTGKAKKVALMGAATATATAMTMGMAPTPQVNAAVSIDIPNPNDPNDPLASIQLPVGVYTTGLPLRLLDLIGQGLTPDDLPIDVTAIEFLTALNPQAFYNAVNGTPFGAEVSVDNPLGGVLPPVVLNPLLHLLSELALEQLNLDIAFDGDNINLGVGLPLRAIVITSFGFASYTTMDTYRKLAESTLTGLPPATGYDPVEQAGDFEPVVVDLADLGLGDLGGILELLGIDVSQDIASVDLPSIPNITVLLLALIRDPGRPNGGIGARFAPLFGLFGVDTVTPDVAPVWPDGFELTEPITVGGDCGALLCVGTTWNGGAALIPLHVNVGWEYDPVSDFPATANPFSIVNSLMAGAFPTYILRAPEVDRLLGQVAGEVVVDLLAALNPTATDEDIEDALNIYLTLGSGALPMLEPQRLLVDVINLFTGLGLGTPISDAVEPALKILVNIGYTDVLTPADIATGDYPGYEAWDRYLGDDDMATPTPFLSHTLTPQEYLQVPGAVIDALIDGFTDTFDEDFTLFDPARNNALTNLLTALGATLPTLDLGATLQGVAPGPTTLAQRGLPGGEGPVSSTGVDVPEQERQREDVTNRLLEETESNPGDEILTVAAGGDTPPVQEEGDGEAEERTDFRPGRRIAAAVREVAENLSLPHRQNQEEQPATEEAGPNEDGDPNTGGTEPNESESPGPTS
ncbi:MAG: hypothetical protein ACSLE6_03790 [Mycobacterium sp.]